MNNRFTLDSNITRLNFTKPCNRLDKFCLTHCHRCRQCDNLTSSDINDRFPGWNSHDFVYQIFNRRTTSLVWKEFSLFEGNLMTNHHFSQVWHLLTLLIDTVSIDFTTSNDSRHDQILLNFVNLWP